ncbi:MAG: hypothetical protein JRJ80_18215 [Deltaproteobacteria bacterium]|nr:hypothetical protein [Deltaproteobacteria bacterium]
MMVKTGEQVSSSDKAGRNFSATLEANLVAGDDVVAKAEADAERPAFSAAFHSSYARKSPLSTERALFCGVLTVCHRTEGAARTTV